MWHRYNRFGKRCLCLKMLAIGRKQPAGLLQDFVINVSVYAAAKQSGSTVLKGNYFRISYNLAARGLYQAGCVQKSGITSAIAYLPVAARSANRLLSLMQCERDRLWVNREMALNLICAERMLTGRAG